VEFEEIRSNAQLTHAAFYEVVKGMCQCVRKYFLIFKRQIVAHPQHILLWFNVTNTPTVQHSDYLLS
jgi:hypothetical protein